MELDNVTSLMRYLYLGSNQCFSLSKRKPLSASNIENQLGFIQNMVVVGNEDFPLKLIKKVMTNTTLTHKNYCLMALAYCIRRVNNEKLREAVYKSLPQLLVTDEDLFQFIQYATMLIVYGAGTSTVPTAPVASRAKGFGKGMRKALSQWYLQRTPMDLVNMTGRNRGLHRWTHKDLILMSHVKFIESDERAPIVKSLFHRGIKTVETIEENESLASLTPPMQRFYKIASLKLCEDPNDAAQKIQLDNLDIEHAPSHFYDEPSFWLAMAPHLKYEQLLNSFLALNDRNLLKVTDDLAKKYSILIGREALVKNSKVQPIQLLSILNGYIDKNRYSEKRKAEWYKKKAEKRGLVVNDHFTAKLKIALNFSFSNIPKMDAQFIITLDLRFTNRKRPVFNMSHLRCIEAMAVLTLGFVKRETDTKVYQFTQNKGQLKAIKMNSNDSYQDVYKMLQDAVISKSSQSLATPISLVAKDKHPKVFITIMDSVARICRQGLPAFPEFENYRRKHKNAKYIVVSLARHQQDLLYYPHKGLLEIAGLSPDTPMIIKAFCSGDFS